ncbi:AAA family ATPase [Clostridium sp. VAP41]|uniref:AAA family ATPase n=1 Tax=Clostridium sp. VAP41 TaxID=2949979 RepID=UPI0020793B94
MIIKQVNIENFAGIKGRTISFAKKFNLIYGENEKGKSTIENFIKIWLYGFEKNRGKDNDRKKFTPLIGGKISGELIVEHEGLTYVIRRSFGLTKKEDTCEILDEVTGDKIDIPYNNEPGKYFLDINVSTFSKTLFINQLGVMVNKDKEEEIMEKITNTYNSGEENVSFKKAIGVLEKGKKQIKTTRKSGELDLLIQKKNILKEELWNAYTLSQENIENEEKLLNNKNEKEEIIKQLDSLELYKNYIKKSNLQKDYLEIAQYLKKSEELKKKEEAINEYLNKNYTNINSEFLEELNKEYNRYLNLNDIKQEKKRELNILQNKLNEKNNDFKEYKVLDSICEEDIKDKLYVLKIEQENLKEKLYKAESIESAIETLKNDLKIRSNKVSNLEYIAKYRDEIEANINLYKDKLKELKYKLESYSSNNEGSSIQNIKKRMIFIYVLFAVFLVVLFISIFKEDFIIDILTVPLLVVLTKFYLKYSLILKEASIKEKNKISIQKLKNEVEKYEEKLNLYMQEINCKDYENLVKQLSQYDSYKIYKENIYISINSKVKELNDFNIEELKNKYNKNKKVLGSLFKLLECNSIEETINKVNIYSKFKKELLPMEYKINSLALELKEIDFQLKDKEEYLRKKTKGMEFENVDILDFHIKIKEYKDKVNKMREVKSNLNSVEETYKVLLKDRDIEQIKKEIKNILPDDLSYSYESEEEIEKEIKKSSSKLLKTEKQIKDLEHLIEKRYLGKRSIAEIEEELYDVQEKILKCEKEFKALEVASLKLQESFKELRSNIGPKLNDEVLKNFNYLTLKNYKDVKISEDYKLKVRDNSLLFDSEILSNGAKDQLYLSLRLSFINMLFKNKKIPIFLDDAFIQYDDNRRERALKLLIKEDFNQVIFFTCQTIEKNILDNISDNYNLIQLS